MLASVVCGVIGVIVIERKLVMMSGGIAHTSYGGVGLGYLLGFEPIIGAFAFSLAAAFGIGVIRKRGTQTDVAIALFWSLGMALGVLFVSLAPSYPPDLSTYLFGNILSVTRPELYLMIVLTVIVIVVILMFYNHWKAYLFDEEFSAVLGMKTTLLEYLLLTLIAMSIVVLIRAVGIILVLALLTAPAAIAGMLTSNFGKRMVIASIFGGVFCILGLWSSYELDIPSGATMVITAVAGYLVVYLGKLFITRRATQKQLSLSGGNEQEV